MRGRLWHLGSGKSRRTEAGGIKRGGDTPHKFLMPILLRPEISPTLLSFQFPAPVHALCPAATASDVLTDVVGLHCGPAAAGRAWGATSACMESSRVAIIYAPDMRNISLVRGKFRLRRQLGFLYTLCAC